MTDHKVEKLRKLVENLGLNHTYPVFARPLPPDKIQNATIMFVDILSKSYIPDMYFSGISSDSLTSYVKNKILISIKSTIALLEDEIKGLEGK